MRPLDLKKAGREVFFVSRQSGMLRALPGLEEISNFESFRRQEVGRLLSRVRWLVVVATYVVNLHEDFEGTADFSGERNLPRGMFPSLLFLLPSFVFVPLQA